MEKKMELAVLGGDKRQIAMARRLAALGYGVSVWGLGDCQAYLGNALICETWQNALVNAEAVILPLPASSDGVRVHCPLQDSDLFLRITTLLDAMSGRLLLGGRLTEGIRSIAEQKNIESIDYFESEVLQLKNAVPTAEGAIAIAMQELPVTLDGTHMAILGYGRIGALLGEKLHALGAHVTVYARRQEQLTLAQLHHHAVKKLDCRDGNSSIREIPKDCRVIFNTVPQWLLTKSVLETIPKSCILIDLASAPGGIDHSTAEALGFRSIWGTALPGKCTPESAGNILADTIVSIIEDRTISV